VRSSRLQSARRRSRESCLAGPGDHHEGRDAEREIAENRSEPDLRLLERAKAAAVDREAARPRLSLCGKEGQHEQRAENGCGPDEESDGEIQPESHLHERKRVRDRGHKGTRE
jgi:hypothetical protein